VIITLLCFPGVTLDDVGLRSRLEKQSPGEQDKFLVPSMAKLVQNAKPQQPIMPVHFPTPAKLLRHDILPLSATLASSTNPQHWPVYMPPVSPASYHSVDHMAGKHESPVEQLLADLVATFRKHV
jgi:hypothetical protein